MNHICANKHQDRKNCKNNSHKRGPSSYHLVDQNVIYKELDIKKGDCFIDLGCGTGDYAIRAMDFVGKAGQVIAIDKQENVISDLKIRTSTPDFANIQVIHADILKPLPIPQNTGDICFLSTVLHILDINKDGEKLLKEIKRILKPGARLITLDCQKRETFFGPPMHMRISPQELEKTANEQGFERIRYMDLEDFYMIQFQVP